MRFRLTPTLLSVLFALACAPGAAAGWLSVDGAAVAPPSVTVADLAPGLTRVDLSLAGVETGTVTIDGRPHATVTLPGQRQILERGTPRLPFVTVSLTVPDAGESRVRVVATEYREFPIDPIEPSRGSILRTVDPRTVPHTFGPAYRGGVFPLTVTELSSPYIVRDQRGVNLRLYPVQWDVDRGVLRVLISATIEVATAGSGGRNIKTRRRGRPVPAFEALYARQFANLDTAAKAGPASAEGSMLVVCHDAFAAVMQPFVAWKIARGVPTELITTSSVGGTVAGIQAAIDQRYHGPEGLAYVVLVGDGAQVPHYTGVIDGADDDTHYVRLEGDDVYPDALISRFSAENADQVAVQVAKVLAYERDTAGAAAWTHQSLGIASDEDGDSSLHDWERMDLIRDRLLAHDFTHVDRVYEHLGAGTGDIAAALNDGRSLVNYMGHGFGLSWGSVYFNTTHVHQLTNTAWPWIIDVSCLNGGISALGESLAEAFLRAGSAASPHGAIGMYSSSSSCAWVEPTVMQHEAVALLTSEATSVLGVLMHAGIMEVLDQYGETGVGLQLVEQYNLFGDCSLVVRTRTPDVMTVTHQPLLPVQTPSLVVETGAAGVTVTVSAGDVIHGSARANSLGSAEVILTSPVDAVDEVTLTVFGANQQTYQAVLPVVDLATVTVTPSTIPVGITTPVTITVTDPDAGVGLADVVVSLVGFGVAGEAATTDTTGAVTVDVTPVYGEVLAVHGRDTGEAYDLFVVALPVTDATPLIDPAVTAAVPSVALDGALTPGREGAVTATLAGAGFTLFVRGDGLVLSETTADTSLSLPVTPTELSPVIATIGRSGHEIFQQEIAVIEALGILTGTVVDTAAGNAPLAEATIAGHAPGAEPGTPPLFTAVTDTSGAYAIADPVPVGSYEIRVTRFGYAAHLESVFLLHGANARQFGLGTASSGEISGTLTATADGAPLAGSVAVHRADNGALIVTAITDPETGGYTTGPLPYYGYRLEVRAFGYVPATMPLTVEAAAHTAHFMLETAPGELLLLADGPVDALAADLAALSYNVTQEVAAASDPATWQPFDLVVYAAGDGGQPLTDADLRDNLVAHAQAGGRLLIEGGEVAFTALDDPTFAVLASDVLHVAAWHGDAGGDVAVGVASHPVMLVPNIIVGPLDISFYDWAVADRVTATADADQVGVWTSEPDQAGVICHDDDPVMPGGETVFFTFAYAAAGEGRLAMLENAVIWLLGAEPDPTSAEDEVLPRRVTLTGNHPNPFNPSTVIRFSLPGAGPVDLAVFDLRGRRVRTLVRDVLPAGHHQAQWRGRADDGQPVASGVYVTRLLAGGEHRVAKMTLLK